MKDLEKEIEEYVKYFKKKRNLDSINKEEINRVLISEKYLEFINSVYNYFNSKNGSKPDKTKERLAIESYLDADEAINHFWTELLGNKLPEDMRALLNNT